jgi:pyruvate dehydrogenase E1 component alpha subunit
MNQGMLMEAYNMAVAWNLPVIFVCKDNKWSITTYSADVTGGTPAQRARGFGLHAETANGDRVEDVFAAAGKLVERARTGKGPGFLHVTCHRPGGHFEGDGLVRLLKTPTVMAAAWGPGLKDGLTHPEGGKVGEKAGGMGEITKRGARAARDWAAGSLMDPISNARPLLDAATVKRIESEERAAIEPAIARARDAVAGRPVFGTPKGGTK